MKKPDIKKIFVSLKRLLNPILNGIAHCKGWYKKYKASKVIPELAPEILYELIMEDYRNNPEFNDKLRSYLVYTKKENGSVSWQLDVALIIRNWLADNSKQVENRYRTRGRKTVKIALHNSQGATQMVIDHFTLP